MATALAQIPETTKPGTLTIEELGPEPRGAARVLPFDKSWSESGKWVPVTSSGLSGVPLDVLFGALRDPQLRLRKAIPLRTDRREGFVSVVWSKLDQFGSGNTLSEAMDDFSSTIAELFWRLHEEGAALGDHLLRVREHLSEYIDRRAR